MHKSIRVAAFVAAVGVSSVVAHAQTYDAIAQFHANVDAANPWQYRSAGGFGGYGTYQAPSASVGMTPQGYSAPTNVINGQTYTVFEGNTWTGGTQLSIAGGTWRNTMFGQADFASTHAGIHLHPHMVGSGYPYWRVDPILMFKPTLTQTTTFRVAFDIASDYDLNSAQDWEANGQYLAFYKNDLVIAANTYWPEDGVAGTGYALPTGSDPTGSNGDGWAYVPGWFARYSAPISVVFDVTLAPGDSLSFRVNSASSNAYDGIFLKQATVTVTPEPATIGVGLAAIGLLGRRRRTA